jgi:hypothetical protein
MVEKERVSRKAAGYLIRQSLLAIINFFSLGSAGPQAVSSTHIRHIAPFRIDVHPIKTLLCLARFDRLPLAPARPGRTH